MCVLNARLSAAAKHYPTSRVQMTTTRSHTTHAGGEIDSKKQPSQSSNNQDAPDESTPTLDAVSRRSEIVRRIGFSLHSRWFLLFPIGNRTARPQPTTSQSTASHGSTLFSYGLPRLYSSLSLSLSFNSSIHVTSFWGSHQMR